MKYRPYRSVYNEEEDEDKSVFSFEDEFGSDPLLRRYGVTPTAVRAATANAELATAKRLNAEADLEVAQAEQEARIAPLRAVADRFKMINELSSQKYQLEQDARTRTAATSINDLLPKIGSATELEELIANNSDGLLDKETSLRVDARRLQLRTRDKAELRAKLPKAMSTAEINDFKMWAGERQLLGDPEVTSLFETWGQVAGEKESLMEGLRNKGVQAMPLTRGGEFDVDTARDALRGEYTRQEVSTDRTILENLNKQRNNITDEESPEAQALDEQIKMVTDRLLAAGNQGSTERARSQEILRGLGGAGEQFESESDSFIYGPSKPKAPAADQPTAPPAPTEPTPAPAPTEQPPEPESEAETTRKAEEAKVTAQSDRAASDVETLTEERDRLYKRGYKFSPSKEQRETYARVVQAVSDARNEEADARRQRRTEIDARLKQIGQFPSDPQLREEAQALIEEKRRLTGAKIF
jgi:hypothetical protein